MKNYWLHRISYEGAVSHPLLAEENYLTIGWQCYLERELYSMVESDGYQGFVDFMLSVGDTNRARWSLEKFFRFRVGDIVIVPMWQEVAIYEVLEQAIPISKMKIQKADLTNWSGEKIEIYEDGLYVQKNKELQVVDLGFAVKVKLIAKKVRSFAEPALVARMKVRSTTSWINDLSECVENLIQATAPTSLYEKLKAECSQNILDSIRKSLRPDQLEKLVKWYMSRSGASIVSIPSKNEAGKECGADADAIATFNDLKIVFYIQVKHHNGTTDELAVHQIKEYKQQKEDSSNDITYVSWVISLAKSYTQEAINSAAENNVRLINGLEFTEMLLNVGFRNIDDCI